MKRISFGLLALCGILGGMLLPVRVIRNDWTVSQMLWNDDQLLLVLGSRHVGWVTNYPMYGLYALLNVVWVAPPYSEMRPQMTVIKITATSEQSFDYPNTKVMYYWPFDDTIVGRFHDQMAKWNGAGWQPLTTDEQHKFDQQGRPGADYDNMNGWSGRCCVLARRDQTTRFDISLHSEPLVIVVTRDEDQRNTRIVLERQHRPPREVWRLDWYPHRATSAEYEAFMAQ